MLFDLRGRGRRRTVQVIYLGLAILLGGGLVLFGIGGDVQGGLFDAFRDNQGDATEQLEQRVDDAEKATAARPQDARVWATLANAEFQLAGQSKGFSNNPQTGEPSFTGAARRHLEAAKAAWERHVRLAGDNADTALAGTMSTALTYLGDKPGAVRAEEIRQEGLDQVGFGDYAKLAVLAYNAGQTRKGDLAADRAKEEAPKDQREQLEQQLEAAKTQAAQGAAGGATPGATPAPTPSPSG
jgi:hypothetical protein